MYEIDKDDQFNFKEKRSGIVRWQYCPPGYKTITEPEANALRAKIVNHPDFDRQMQAIIDIFGKKEAESYLAKVLENQKYRETSKPYYKKIYV